MTNINLPDYLNRYDPAKGYDELLFRSDKVIQAEEFNELQSGFNQRLRGISDALMSDGAIVRDAKIVVNAQTGATQCENGAIYADGAVRGVPPANFSIAIVGTVIVGVYLQERVVTELDDPGLRNRAKNTRGVDQPGAARLKKTLAWGYAGDNQVGKFYPVYTVIDGSLLSKEPPPNLDGVTQAIARYDRDSSGGSYVVDGLSVSMADNLGSGEQVYTVTEGRARINGMPVEFNTSRRLVYAASADLRFIENEPHQSTTVAAQRVLFDRVPAANIVRVTITAQKTADVAHGGFTGALDPLEDSSVLEVLSVKQGATTYLKDVDFKLTAGQIDWSLAGAEPAPGSTYKVSYKYLSNVQASSVDQDGFTVTGAVVGTAILVSYNRMLPRIDRLCLDAAGALTWIKGIAADRNPRPPVVPSSLLPLASIVQGWRPGKRAVINDSVRVVPMDILANYNRRLDTLAELMAQQRLESSANLREATAKRGMLVDPFLSDAVRDQGLPQTGAIFNGQLTLPVMIQPNAMALAPLKAATLPFNLVPALEQLLRTGSMKVNPYSAFDTLPAEVTLNPAIDRWTDIDTQWLSPATETIVANQTRQVGVWVQEDGVVYSSSNVMTRDISRTQRAATYCRQIDVSFSIRGFDPIEQLSQIKFDGITVPAQNLAQANGVLSGKFKVPEKIPTGNKRVEFIGNQGNYGMAVYSATGVQVTNVQQLVTVHASGWVTFLRNDPLAQTFTLASDRQIAAVDLWFTAKGDSLLSVQIRETTVGIPNQKVITQTRVAASTLVINGGPSRIHFDYPVNLVAGTEYALVIMCDDAITAAAVAELGKFDANLNQWVSSQPYTVGVLLSSSNASTWTAHQDRDLAFRLLAADYSAANSTVALGNVNLVSSTDLLLLSLVEAPAAATRVEYKITLPGGEVINLDDGQPLRLSAPTSGQIQLAARLAGNTTASPVLHPSLMLLAGTVANQGSYISPLIPGGQNVRAKVVIDAYLPAGTNLSVFIAAESQGAPQYSQAGFVSSREIRSGWFELTYELAGINADRLRAKLEFTGSTLARPCFENFRLMSL